MARWPGCTFKTVRATRTLQALARWDQWKIMPWKKISKKCNKSNFTLIPCGLKLFLWNIVLRDHVPIKDRDIYFLCAASTVPWDVSTPLASNCSVHSSFTPAERVPLAHCCRLKVVTRTDNNLFPGTVKLCPQCSSCRVLLGPMRTLHAGQSTCWVSVRLQLSLRSIYVNAADPRAVPAAQCEPQRWCRFRP